MAQSAIKISAQSAWNVACSAGWTLDSPVISPKINPKVLDICQFGPGVTSITVTSSRGGPIDYHRYRSEMEPPDNSVTYSHEIFRIFGSLFILLNNQQLTILTNMYSSKTIFIPPKPWPLQWQWQCCDEGAGKKQQVCCRGAGSEGSEGSVPSDKAN